MIPTDNKTKTTDIWFEQQLEAIRQLKPKQTPDVTDAVMQRIASMPQPMALPKRHSHINTRLANGLVAACFVGIVVTTFLVTRNGAQAATPHPDLSNRFYDVYSYCNDYANDESDESAAYYDNPVTNIF